MTIKQFGWAIAVGVVSALVASYIQARLSPSDNSNG